MSKPVWEYREIPNYSLALGYLRDLVHWDCLVCGLGHGIEIKGYYNQDLGEVICKSCANAIARAVEREK